MSKGNVEVKLKGTRELNKAIKKAKKKLNHKKIADIFETGAQMMKDQTQQNVPVGSEGNLRDAVVVRKMGTDPVVFIVAMDRQKAPHAHLVEHGTGPRYQDSTGKYVGEMPANPYWRPSWDAVSPKIEQHMLSELRTRIERGG